jgi:type VI secretion system secreted protein VgrG
MTAKQVVSIEIASGDEAWGHVRVQRLSGREAIGQLFSFDVDVVCDPGHDLPESAQLDQEAAIVFSLDDVEVRRIHGVIGAIRAHVGALHGDGRASYRLRVVPRAARLALVETQEVYLGQSVPEILRAKLERHGFEGADVDLRIIGAYAPREIVVQYAESDLAFVSRLAEHVGIGFSFEHEDGRDRLVFSDHADGYAKLAGRAEVPFLGRGEKGGVFALDRVSELTPTSYIVQDYNYRTPRVDLSACADLEAGSGGGVVEYGAGVKTPAEAEQIARVRSEERRSRQIFFEGQSGAMELSAGRRAAILDVPHANGPQKVLVVEVTHEAFIPVFAEDDAREARYANAFRAVPDVEGFTYRPPRATPRPRIGGVITGVIQPGPEGETGGVAKIDAEGRYTVEIHLDASPHGEQKASHPMRMMQPFAGPGYGMHMPLRRGTEVLVAFANGDPDRPVILGAVYNAASPSPVVASSANKHRIQTSAGVLFELGSKA